MMKDTIKEGEDKMKKSVEALRKDFSTVRAGRATPSLLDKIHIEYYGAMMPVNQLANVAVPEPRLITVQPWDKTAIPHIEKAILKSDLGLNPSNDGNVIRIIIPQLTEERRKDLVKLVKKRLRRAVSPSAISAAIQLSTSRLWRKPRSSLKMIIKKAMMRHRSSQISILKRLMAFWKRKKKR